MFKTPQIYLLLFSLYWAQGLPVGFMTHALPVILRAQGVSLAHIGGFGLLMAPWALKVFWSPWIDRKGSDHFGHYRSWIIPTQILTIFILVLLSFLPIQSLNHPHYLLLFFISLLFMNTVGATQDIATDGLAVNILKGNQQHIGNMFQVIGSRLGFIVGGGAILWSLDWLNWQSTFLILALIVAINTLPILCYSEPQDTRKHIVESQKTQSTLQSIRVYIQYFFSTRVMLSWLVVLCVIKVSDGLSGPIIKPLLVDLGLNLTQIGVYITMLGACAALLGAALASWSLKYLTRPQALFSFALLKIGSLAGFAGLAYAQQQGQTISPTLIYWINALEDMFAAMLLVVILTLVMQYSRKSHAGTDFTFQVSIMSMVSGGLYTVSGIVGDWLGYSTYLTVICILGIALLMPILYWMKMYDQSQADV